VHRGGVRHFSVWYWREEAKEDTEVKRE
jgi:hypothetical protein